MEKTTSILPCTCQGPDDSSKRSCSATCTFLRAIHQMWWRQSLFQEPSINVDLFPLATVPSKIPPSDHLFHSSHNPEYPSFTSTALLTFTCQHLTNLQDPKQMPPLPWNHSWILSWNSNFLPLCFHMISYCICTWIIIIIYLITSTLF